MLELEFVSETLYLINPLMRLSARETFIEIKYAFFILQLTFLQIELTRINIAKLKIIYFLLFLYFCVFID
jgi:hypothetical protein